MQRGRMYGPDFHLSSAVIVEPEPDTTPEILEDEEAHRRAVRDGGRRKWSSPSEYIKALPGDRFLVFMLKHTDHAVNTTNPAEGLHSPMSRNRIRTGSLADALAEVLRFPAVLFRHKERFVKLKERGQLFAPIWPCAFRGGEFQRPGDYLAEYKASNESETSCKVTNVHTNVSHTVAFPRKRPSSALHWLRATSAVTSGAHHVSCSASCGASQRGRHPCVHLLRGIAHLPKDTQEAIIRSATALYYQVDYLLERWEKAECFHVYVPDFRDLVLGPLVRPIKDLRKVKVDWDPKNGGRRAEDVDEVVAEEQETLTVREAEELIREQVQLGEPAARIASLGEGRKTCTYCGGEAHNIRSCQVRTRDARRATDGMSTQELTALLAAQARQARFAQEQQTLYQRQMAATAKLLREADKSAGAAAASSSSSSGARATSGGGSRTEGEAPSKRRRT